MSSTDNAPELGDTEGTSKPPRKAPPEISAGEPDRPAVQSNGQSAENPGPPTKTRTREPITFDQFSEHLKFEFGKKLIVLCIVVIAILSVIGYMNPRDSPLLQDALSLLKLIATTALGFVFARAMDSKGKNTNIDDD